MTPSPLPAAGRLDTRRRNLRPAALAAIAGIAGAALVGCSSADEVGADEPTADVPTTAITSVAPRNPFAAPSSAVPTPAAADRAEQAGLSREVSQVRLGDVVHDLVVPQGCVTQGGDVWVDGRTGDNALAQFTLAPVAGGGSVVTFSPSLGERWVDSSGAITVEVLGDAVFGSGSVTNDVTSATTSITFNVYC